MDFSIFFFDVGERTTKNGSKNRSERFGWKPGHLSVQTIAEVIAYAVAIGILACAYCGMGISRLEIMWCLRGLPQRFKVTWRNC